MASWSEAAHALPPPQPRQRRAQARAQAAPAGAAHGVAGGVVWIAVTAVLLTGVVALNVAVLRLNVRLDKLDAERAKLRADTQALASQLSAAASPRGSRRSRARLGLVPADPPRRPTSSWAPGQVRAKAPNRRIRLLLAVFVLAFAITFARAAWLQVRARGVASDGSRRAAQRGRHDSRRPRHDLRPQRRPARDRRAGDDGLRRPAAGRAIRAREADDRRADPRPRPERSCTRRSPTGRAASSTSSARPIPRRAAGSHGSALPGSASTRRSGASTRSSAVASQVLGYAGVDNHGLAGLELSLDTLARRAGRPRDGSSGTPSAEAIDAINVAAGARRARTST